MTDFTSAYRKRVNDANLAAQAASVKKLGIEILKELRQMENCFYWSLEGDEQDAAQWPTSMIEHAHTLVDMAHEFRAALAVNPPPKPLDEDGG